MVPLSPLYSPDPSDSKRQMGLQSFEVPCSPQILGEAAREHMPPPSMLRPPAPPCLLERSALTLP